MAYISNAEEEQLLKNANFQKKLALAVAISVTQYLTGTTSIAQGNDAISGDSRPGSKDDKQEQEPPAKQVELPTRYYKVKKGDTLFSVARNFNTQAVIVAKLNNMKTKDPLHVGKRILVPLKNGEEKGTIEGDTVNAKIDSRAPKKAIRIYTVKKGDTLFSLARKNSTTVEEICRINRLKKSDNLLSGQKIKLPKT
jgi:LysM repeat protein